MSNAISEKPRRPRRSKPLAPHGFHGRCGWALVLAPLFAAVAATAASSPVSSAGPVAPAIPLSPPATSGEIEDVEWKFITRISAVAGYDDNLFIRPSNEAGDTFAHLAPTFAVGIGRFRTEIAPFTSVPHLLVRTGEETLPRKNFAFVSYTPDAVWFSKFREENTVNHDVRAAARSERDRWRTQGEFRFQRVTDADIEAGRRRRQTYYDADGRAAYHFSGKMSGTLGVHGNYADYSDGLWSAEARVIGGFEYQVAPKTAVGLGVAVGRLDVASGGDQTYQQPLLQLKYVPSEKLSFLGQVGEEFRQFDSDIADRSRFLFLFNGDYQPSEGTVFTASARRDTVSSGQFAGENIVETIYQGKIRQRFLQRTTFLLSGGLIQRNYENNRPAANLSRRDDYYFGRVGASRDITKHGTIELGYEHRENDSTHSNFGFTQNIATLSASFVF